jgi:hypothetical protein
MEHFHQISYIFDTPKFIVIQLDEERLFKGGRKWKIGVAFGIILFFLLIALTMFALMTLTTIPRGYTEFAKYKDSIYLFGIGAAVFSVPMSLLIRYYKHLYHYAEFEQSSTGAYEKPTPTKCNICGRHPVSKRYHIRSIHKIKTGSIEQHFTNCGCKYCVKPVHITGPGV